MKGALGFAILAAPLLGGCAGVIPEAVREGIDPNFTFSALRADPDGARGKRVAFGGEILGATVRAEETEIQVLHRPLRYKDVPNVFAPSGGRFLVRRAGFLDPAIYAAGRLLTVVGTVVGAAERPIGEFPYRYPVIQAERLYLWYRPVIVAWTPSCYYLRPWYPPPFYPDPYWWDLPFCW